MILEFDKLSSGQAYATMIQYAIHVIGAAPQGLILGRVQEAYLHDGIATTDNNRLTVDAKALDPVARLGGNDYICAK